MYVLLRRDIISLSLPGERRLNVYEPGYILCGFERTNAQSGHMVTVESRQITVAKSVFKSLKQHLVISDYVVT